MNELSDRELAAYALIGIEDQIQHLTAIRDRLRTLATGTIAPAKVLHWTQRPENRARVIRRMRRMARATG